MGTSLAVIGGELRDVEAGAARLRAALAQSEAETATLREELLNGIARTHTLHSTSPLRRLRDSPNVEPSPRPQQQTAPDSSSSTILRCSNLFSPRMAMKACPTYTLWTRLTVKLELWLNALSLAAEPP